MKEATKSPNDPEVENKKNKKKLIIRFSFVKKSYVGGIHQMIPPAK
jgi:hypothetical protein